MAQGMGKLKLRSGGSVFEASKSPRHDRFANGIWTDGNHGGDAIHSLP